MLFRRKRLRYPSDFCERVLKVLGNNLATRMYLESGDKVIGSMLMNFNERACGTIRAIMVKTLLDRNDIRTLNLLVDQEIEKAKLYEEWKKIWTNRRDYMVYP